MGIYIYRKHASYSLLECYSVLFEHVKTLLFRSVISQKLNLQFNYFCYVVKFHTQSENIMKYEIIHYFNAQKS